MSPCDRLERARSAGILADHDVRLARFLGAHAGCDDEEVLLAAALAARAPRFGAVLADLAEPPAWPESAGGGVAVPWPDPERWARKVAESPLAREDPRGPASPLVVEGTHVYLRRLFEEERRLAERLRLLAEGRGSADRGGTDGEREERIERWVGQAGDPGRRAAERTLGGNLLLLVGGPGTGKTTLVARLVGLLLESSAGHPPEVLLAAPTGKAAARLREAVAAELGRAGLDEDLVEGSVRRATTIHGALGLHVGPGARPRHHRGRPLPHDVVVVDECSMVDLELFGRLVDAVAEDALLVLVGDPDQLASVEAGAVLGDLAVVERGPLADAIVRLERRHRFREGGAIAELADAVRSGEAEEALRLLGGTDGDVTWDELGEGSEARARLSELVEEAAERFEEIGRQEDPADALAALSRFRLLTSHRVGPFGCDRINRLLEERFGGRRAGGPYPGRPILVSRNDPITGLFHGDVGLVREQDGKLVACFEDPGSPGSVRSLPVQRLPEHEPVYAMTIHKAQGSEFDDVWILLSPGDSPLLTRELLFTGVTRARGSLRLVAGRGAVERACARRVRRPSGLRGRLEVRDGE